MCTVHHHCRTPYQSGPLPLQISVGTTGPTQQPRPQPPALPALRPTPWESKVLLPTWPQMTWRRHQQLESIGHGRTSQPRIQRRPPTLRCLLLALHWPLPLRALSMLGCSGQAPAWGLALHHPSTPAGVQTALLEIQPPRQARARWRLVSQAILKQEHPQGSLAWGTEGGSLAAHRRQQHGRLR